MGHNSARLDTNMQPRLQFAHSEGPTPLPGPYLFGISQQAHRDQGRDCAGSSSSPFVGERSWPLWSESWRAHVNHIRLLLFNSVSDGMMGLTKFIRLPKELLPFVELASGNGQEADRA